MKENLLIDIGNSEIKIAAGKGNVVRLLSRFPYSKKCFTKDLIANFSDVRIKAPSATGISELINVDKEFLKEFFRKRKLPEPVFINRNMNMPIRIDYSKGIGNDRICSAVAAFSDFGKRNILIIDLGSATTLTFISNGVLKGGMIAPGIKTSLEALTKKTSLQNVKLNFTKRLINNNTIDNIKAGVLYQSLFFIQRMIEELKKEHRNLFIILTGGNAELMKSKLTTVNAIDRNLVLKGINILISK